MLIVIYRIYLKRPNEFNYEKLFFVIFTFTAFTTFVAFAETRLEVKPKHRTKIYCFN